MQRLSYGSHVGILCAASCARPASRRAECPQWCAAPYVAIRRMDRVRVLAQIVDVAGWHPPSTGPQPTFEPPSASSITNPSVVGPSVGSAAADPQPESWSEWAERLVQEQNAIVSMHHIPVLAGLGIYDLEGRPEGRCTAGQHGSTLALTQHRGASKKRRHSPSQKKPSSFVAWKPSMDASMCGRGIIVLRRSSVVGARASFWVSRTRAHSTQECRQCAGLSASSQITSDETDVGWASDPDLFETVGINR